MLGLEVSRAQAEQAKAFPASCYIARCFFPLHHPFNNNKKLYVANLAQLTQYPGSFKAGVMQNLRAFLALFL